MLIEIIFRGIFSVLDFSFLRELLAKAREVYFNFPEINSAVAYNDIIEIINSDTYIDLVINTDYLLINEKNIPKVFINLGRDNEDIELLFFFDLKDLGEATQKMNIDYLKSWAEEFQKRNNFGYFICQIDNANKDEYYFDIYGIGKLYKDINT